MNSNIISILKPTFSIVAFLAITSCTHVPFSNWNHMSKCEKVAEVSMIAGAIILTGLISNDHISLEAGAGVAVIGGVTAAEACN